MKNHSLLAPNGKPSNLNAMQYKLVRTPAFINWFGDWINDPANASKALDENGEPLVVYHGTKTNFTEFNIDLIASNTGNFGHYGYGFYFSDDVREAKYYGDIILTCFLNFRNPFTWEHKNIILLKENGVYWIDDLEDVAFDKDDLIEKVSKVSIPASDLLNSISKNGYENGWENWLKEYNVNDYEIDFNEVANLLEDSFIDENKQFLKSIGVEKVKTIKDFPYEQSLHWITNLGERSQEVTEVIFDLGFDSIIYGSEHIAFKSTQIKLADGTNTNFDSNNKDIRFEQGGELKAESMLKHPLTIKRLKDLDDIDGFWVKQYHAKTKNYKPNTYYHLNTNGLNAGVGKGLYLGRDKDALISFYDLEGENRKVDTYIGNPNWLDLMDYADYDRYEQQAIEKYSKNNASKYPISDLDNRGEMLRKLAIQKGFDGIRYYDPQATGEEFVLFNVKKVNKIEKENKFENGGRTIAQTPAPKQDQIYGSDVNKKNSSKDLSSAKLIKFDIKTINTIKNKVAIHNEHNPNKKINLASAKSVVRRGMGAYSQSHRPTITNGLDNSRVAWGLARLNAFTYKIINGKSKSGKYSQDDDLIEELGFKVANYKNGGEMSKDIRCINCGWEWNKKDSEVFDMYVCHKCGFDNTTFYTSDPINKLVKGGGLNSNKGVLPDYLKMFLGK